VPTRPNEAIRRELRTLFNLGVIGELSDGQLLERFATRGGEAAELAFAALVERHGAMVLRVCRHALGDPNDAQDAFQATFLILIEKARSLWVRDSIGPWLHRVAHRVAIRARTSAARRHAHERRAAALRPARVSDQTDAVDLTALLHAEIDRLPERLRLPAVLCDVQGLTHEQAARHLGWPIGTVKSRLAKGRELLRSRLSRRGTGLPAGLPVVKFGPGGLFRAADVTLPRALIDSTVRSAAHAAAGKALAAGVVTARVAILIQEVQKTMFLTKLKLAAAAVALIGAAGVVGVLAQPGAGRQPRPFFYEPLQAADLPRQAAGGESPPVPPYIAQSRAMIVTRLEEEVAEARARLDRALRKARSPADPAAVHARKTLYLLERRLDRIDRVLVDVVEAYPTLFDFSRDPSEFAPRSKAAASPGRDAESDWDRAEVDFANELDLASATERAKWAQSMFDKGYLSKAQLYNDLANYERVKARVQARRSQSQQAAPSQKARKDQPDRPGQYQPGYRSA
jgi:RNA polymerase sigma factor (sigma-70 family)